MKYEIVGREIEVTPSMKEHIEKKLSVVEKYFLIKPNTKARIVVKVHKNDQKVEITIPTTVCTLRSEVITDDFYKAIDLAIDKLEGQIRKQKTRFAKKKTKKDSFTENFIKEMDKVEKENTLINKEKSIALTELTPEEAIAEMELSDHDFYVFKDLNGETCLLYRRNKGYGLMYLL